MSSMLASIPRDMWNHVPSLNPPPGQAPNFKNPGDIGPSCLAAASVFFAILLVFYLARAYAKCLIQKKLSWDDLTCTLSLIGAIWLYVAYLISIKDGPVGIHQWNVSLEVASQNTWLWGNYWVSVMSTPALGFAKISLFILYLQLFWPFRWLRICVYIGAPLTAAFYGAVTIVQFYYATPKDGYTPFTYLLSPWEAKAEILYVPISAVGLGFDVFLLVLPVSSVLKLQMRGKKKIGLILVFLTGILACVTSALNIYYRRKLMTSSDTLYWSAVAQLMMSIELSAGISIACMPAFSKVLQHPGPHARSMLQTITSKRTLLRQTGNSSNTARGHHQDQHGSTHELVNTRNTFASARRYREIGSEEHMHFAPAPLPKQPV